jgi:hypothetical protein
MATVNTSTQLTILVFSAIYLYLIFRKTGGNKLDLHDLIMLSMAAVLPTVFSFFPSATANISRWAGVSFPFVVMFGLLTGTAFMIIHRLVLRIHKLETDNCLLIQEISLFTTQLATKADKSPRPSQEKENDE